MIGVGDPAPDLRLHPVFGLPVDLARGPRVLAFFPALDTTATRATIAALETALPRFDPAGIAVLGIARGRLHEARDFVPRHHVLFPVVIDEPGICFEAFGVPRRAAGLLRPGGPLAALRAWRAGAPFDQLPAWVVVGADGRVRFARMGRTVMDQPDIETLWNAATH